MFLSFIIVYAMLNRSFLWSCVTFIKFLMLVRTIVQQLRKLIWLKNCPLESNRKLGQNLSLKELELCILCTIKKKSVFYAWFEQPDSVPDSAMVRLSWVDLVKLSLVDGQVAHDSFEWGWVWIWAIFGPPKTLIFFIFILMESHGVFNGERKRRVGKKVELGSHFQVARLYALFY